MISAIKLKKFMASASIFGIIIGKFCHRKKLYSVILFKINKDLKVNFYCTILLFSLIVYLQVESDREFLLDAKEKAQ